MRTRYIGLALLLVAATVGNAAESSTNGVLKFLGSPSCSSTSCHGGAGEKSNQLLVWSKLDYHSRSYATLISARSERFAEVLKLGDATKSARCTVCHAPFQTVEEQHRLPSAKPANGVSCESCHGPAENWLRSHTRPDFSHGDRVAAGMRDLRSLYGRANTCVACHQTLDPEIAAAGHPDLIFELDGQTVSEPKHWHEVQENVGPKAWIVGQAVALREMSWQLSRDSRDENLMARWSGLLWVLQQFDGVEPRFSGFKSITPEDDQENFEATQKAADRVARAMSENDWTDDLTRKFLGRLTASSKAFLDPNVSRKVHARRAERLVLALDRLVIRLEANPAKEMEAAVNRLFKQVQSIPDFNPEAFARELSAFPSL